MTAAPRWNAASGNTGSRRRPSVAVHFLAMQMYDSSTLRRIGVAWMLTLAAGAVQPAWARPEFLVKFQSDPMRRAEVDGCGTCHVKPEGGGARNDFGTAFDAATRDITPLLRASFPKYFDVASAKLPDGTTFFMSDPQSRVVVVERQNQKVLVTVADITTPKTAPLPPAQNRMTFFVTSEGVGQGGHLGGLAGADRHCQALAKAAGAGDRIWRAYLSTSFQGKPAVNAGDRIGAGPWYNAAGLLVARGPVDLHTKEHLAPALFLTEQGLLAASALPIVTGTLPNGTAAVDQTCNGWTSATTGDAVAGDPAGVWNSARTVSCGPAAQAVARVYCFVTK